MKNGAGGMRHLSESLSPAAQERPKSAVFPGEGKVKMSVEEQIDRMRRHQSGSVKEKRRSLQLPASPAPDPGPRPAYKVVMSWHLTALLISGRGQPGGWREGAGRTPVGHLGRLGQPCPCRAEKILQQVFAF